MCVQFCTELAVLFKSYKICMYIGECHKIKDGCYFHGKEKPGNYYFFSPEFVTPIIIKLYNEMIG